MTSRALDDSTSPAAGRRDRFRPPRVRRGVPLLVAGQTVSQFGDQVTVLALPLVALGAGASPGQVAVLVGVTRAPFLLLGLPAGVWVSRLGLRRSMVLADVVRGVSLGSLPVTAALADISYAQLVVVALAVGSAAVLFQVAYQSVTPLLVTSSDQLRTANTWLTGSEAFALIAGPAVAGLLTGLIGAVRALAVDAGSYLVSAATLLRLRAPTDRPALPSAPLHVDILAGVRYVASHAVLTAVLWSSVLFNAGVAGYEAMLVVFAVDHLGLSPATLGLAMGIGGAGVPVGLLLAKPLDRRCVVGPVLILGGALSAVGLVVASAAAGPPAAILLGVGTFLTATGGGLWGLTALTTRQAVSRPEMRAISTAVHRWATYGVVPLGALAAGAVTHLLGVRAAIVLASTPALLCVVPLLRSPVRNLKRLPPP